MSYPIIPELYDLVAQKLLDEVGGKNFYSGSFAFDYGSKECRFTGTLIVYRRTERLPEGDYQRICDLVPVWWEFHTYGPDGECPNDFSFNDLKLYLFP